MKLLNKAGESLVEMLAAIVILGIIAIISVPLEHNVIETTKKKAELGNIQNKYAYVSLTDKEGTIQGSIDSIYRNGNNLIIVKFSDGTTITTSPDRVVIVSK